MPLVCRVEPTGAEIAERPDPRPIGGRRCAAGAWRPSARTARGRVWLRGQHPILRRRPQGGILVRKGHGFLVFTECGSRLGGRSGRARNVREGRFPDVTGAPAAMGKQAYRSTPTRRSLGTKRRSAASSLTSLSLFVKPGGSTWKRGGSGKPQQNAAAMCGPSLVERPERQVAVDRSRCSRLLSSGSQVRVLPGASSGGRLGSGMSATAPADRHVRNGAVEASWKRWGVRTARRGAPAGSRRSCNRSPLLPAHGRQPRLQKSMVSSLTPASFLTLSE
jgi:hypothetical protein